MERAPNVASPCVNVCLMDESTGLCAGCARTLDEIAAWSEMNDHEKAHVLARLPERIRQSSLPPDRTQREP